MKRLFRTAQARVNRAEEHLADLKALVERVRKQYSDAPIEDDFRLSMRGEVFGIELGEPMLGILIGETVYNLRASLDYLVYALAQEDSGSFQNGTQFPIEDTPDGFAGRLKQGFLKGINEAHKATIEGLQPYNGCNWTKTLRDLSNPDKHRHLVRLKGHHATWYREVPPPKTGTIALDPSVRYVDMETRRSLDVTLADGTPIVDTLEQLKSEVANLLQAFDPDFKTP